jgi:cobalt/nickel transport system permease protein
MISGHHEIDRYAKTSRLYSLDPRVKLACAISFIVVISFIREALPLWIALTFVLILIEISGVPLRHIAENFLLAFPFIIFAALTMWLTSSALNGFLIGMRISTSVLALMLLISTTPFFDTLRTLRWFRVPPLICNMLMFTYRFIFVLLDEFDRMMMARRSRGFSGGRSLLDRSAFTTISNTIGMVFVRSNQRAGRIYDALLGRGYNGEIRTLTVLKARGRDVAYGVCFVMVSIVLVGMQLGVIEWMS